jgi:hypothetical protein
MIPFPIKNLVVEWRYDPSLAFYSQMDQIGCHFADDYPDWQRSALTLQIHNKKHHRRFFMSYSRCFFEAIIGPGDDVAGEVDRSKELFERFSHELKIRTLRRFGFRQWAAFERKESFNDLVYRANKKFQATNASLEELLRGTMNDLCYVADVTTHQGWKYALRAGPMERKQWFEFVPHEPLLFESPESLNTYQDAFAERLLFADLDCFKEDVPISDLSSLITTIQSTSFSILSDFNKYFSED